MSYDTIIDFQKSSDNKNIPTGILPKQYEIDTKFYCSFLLSAGNPALFVVKPVFSETNNVKNHKNEWAPYSAQISSAYSFKAEKYGDLVKEINNDIIPGLEYTPLFHTSFNFFKDFQSQPVVEEFNNVEVHLKNSPATMKWLAYQSQGFILTALEKSSPVFNQPGPNHAMIPLDETLNETLKTGKYKGVPLSSDLIQTLQNPGKLKILQDYAL